MIGRIDPTQKKVTVIGAGISGLLVAYTLKKKGYEVTVLEAGNRVGGLLQSTHSPHGLVESAAHSFLMTDAMVDHFSEIGITPIPVKTKARYIYRNGKPRRLPLTFFEILGTLFRYLRKKSALSDHSTFKQWGMHHLGEAATKYLIAPFVTGVFAATPEELEFRLAFPKSPKKEKKRMMTLPGGLETWALELSKALAGNIHLSHPIQDLPEGCNVVIATPTAQAAVLLRSVAPQASSLIQKIPYAPLITMTVFVKNEDFRSKVPSGIGVLIPRGEGLRILGVLYNSSSFEGRIRDSKRSSLTVMLGGTTDPNALQLSDAEIEKILRLELNQLLGWSGQDLEIHTTRWQSAIPIYGPDLRLALDCTARELSSLPPGILVAGNWTGNVSLRGILSDVLELKGIL